MRNPAQNQGARDGALDGLRGWAALSVVVYHCLWQSFGRIFPELHNIATALLGNGVMAVGVFLAISGYVLTARRWHRTDNPSLLYSFARRYIRLTLPALGSILVVWVLMTLSLTPTEAAFQITKLNAWYGTFVHFKPDFGSALQFAFVSEYWVSQAKNYNPFLWTIAVELWASLYVFVLSKSDRGLREAYSPLLLLAAIGFATFPLVACFPFGAALALLERDGAIFRTGPTRVESRVATAVLIAAIIAGALVQLYLNRNPLLLTLSAMAIFVCSKRSLPAIRFLETPLSAFMGRISYPIYILQFAVIVSPAAIAIVWLNQTGNLDTMTALATGVLSVAATLVLAVVFLPVEIGTLALIRRLDTAFKRRGAARMAVAG